MILSSDPALTAPMVRAGESVRDAFIILKGHLLVTATTTSTIAAASSSASSSDVVGMGVGVDTRVDRGVDKDVDKAIAENKQSSDDPFAMAPMPDDDEMGHRSSDGNHTATSVSLNTGE